MVEFRKLSEYPKGTLYRQLVDAYSFDPKCQKGWDGMWRAYDDFIYANLEIIGDRYAFITAVDGVAVGHISWDP